MGRSMDSIVRYRSRKKDAAFLLALFDTLIEEPMLYLCDNQSYSKAVYRWIGIGRKARLVWAADVDHVTKFW